MYVSRVGFSVLQEIWVQEEETGVFEMEVAMEVSALFRMAKRRCRTNGSMGASESFLRVGSV